MSPMVKGGFIVRQSMNITNSEKKCLESFLDGEIRNAYNIRELTNYKHYPTVLRAVKKLEIKGLIKKEGIDKIKKSTYYSITFEGMLYSSIINNNTDEAYRLICSSSKHFIDIIDVFNSTYIEQNIFNDVYAEIFRSLSIRKEYNIDKIIENSLGDIYMDHYLDLTNVYNDNDFLNIKDKALLMLEESKKYLWMRKILQNTLRSLYEHAEKDFYLYQELNDKINLDL